RIVELTRDCAALAGEKVVARDRRPRREVVARTFLDERGELARLREIETRRDSVERLEREGDLGQVGFSGAPSHPVHRSVHPRGARLDGGDRRRGGEAEV